MILPLVESVTDSYQGPYLNKVLIIGVQHILETTHAMFRSLYKLGLQPKNVMIVGKCYSTCKEVYDEMRSDGIDVDPGSFSYSSHESFDQHFQKVVEDFINQRLKKINRGDIEKIIVLDDGGKCIELIQKKLDELPPIVAVEQTSSGYEAIKTTPLSFPVINVARTKTKLTLESPMIAKAAIDRLLPSLSRSTNARRALILGGGPIGLSVKEELAKHMIMADVYDIKSSEEPLEQILGKYNLVLGCTGKTSVPEKYHHHLSSGTVLASISSSDREFDAAQLRRKLPETKNCHEDLHIGDILLVRSGFPINFDGDRENIDPEKIQLTIALMTAGILQGVEQDLLHSRGLVPLREQSIESIEENFTRLMDADQISLV